MIIEKNIKSPEPISRLNDSEPAKIGTYSSVSKKLEVGDSVFFDGAKNDSSKGVQAVRRYLMRRGLKYATRKENNGVRIWRLS